MAKPLISTKRLAVSKANAQVVIIVGVASFVTIFCLVASQAVWSQTQYQSRVIKKKEAANKQLKANITAFNSLSTSYSTFVGQNPNSIGGDSNSAGDNGGDNAKIILDALPSSYDFPALASSLEKIFKDQNLAVGSITGTDDQVAQQTNLISPTPTPVPIPFSFSISGANYDSIQKLITKLQQSIRPIQIDTMTLGGGSANMQLSVTGHTYYQPGKSLNITKTVVK